MKKLNVMLLASAFLTSTPSLADEADLKARLEKLQQEIDALRAQLQQVQAQTSVIADQQEKTAAASPPAAESDTQIGGYGEINYNRFREDSSRTQADLRRFVLFFGHRFNDRLSFKSEVEWEHAVTSADDRGETEIEQAYLDYSLAPGLGLKAGLFLMPFGFLNQSHEPPVYYGVERNEVETRIIPTTWREGGVSLYGSTEAGLAWDLGITTGFDISKFDDPSSPLASVHQELQLAKAHDLAFYGALNYRGVPGLTVGGAIFTGNSTHGNAAFQADDTQPDFAGIKARVTLWDVHARWQPGKWDFQTLYAKGRIGDADRVDQALLDAGRTEFVPAEFYGWLLQGAYRIWERGDMSVTPFARYERFNTQSKMPAGFAADPANADRVATLGLSFKPHPQVVFKADYQKFRNNPSNDRFNLGVGYMF